jgi:hypothetical protein
MGAVWHTAPGAPTIPRERLKSPHGFDIADDDCGATVIVV